MNDCQHCGQPIAPRPGLGLGWIHLSSAASHGHYVMCHGQDGYPPVRRATPAPAQEGDPHG